MLLTRLTTLTTTDNGLTVSEIGRALNSVDGVMNPGEVQGVQTTTTSLQCLSAESPLVTAATPAKINIMVKTSPKSGRCCGRISVPSRFPEG